MQIVSWFVQSKGCKVLSILIKKKIKYKEAFLKGFVTTFCKNSTEYVLKHPGIHTNPAIYQSVWITLRCYHPDSRQLNSLESGRGEELKGKQCKMHK